MSWAVDDAIIQYLRRQKFISQSSRGGKTKVEPLNLSVCGGLFIPLPKWHLAAVFCREHKCCVTTSPKVRRGECHVLCSSATGSLVPCEGGALPRGLMFLKSPSPNTAAMGVKFLFLFSSLEAEGSVYFGSLSEGIVHQSGKAWQEMQAGCSLCICTQEAKSNGCQ